MGKRKKKTPESEKLMYWTIAYGLVAGLLTALGFTSGLYSYSPQTAVFLFVFAYFGGYAIYRAAID